MTVKQITSMDWVRLVERAVVFFVVPWAVWATANIYDMTAFHKYGDRHSRADASQMEHRLEVSVAEVRELLYTFERDFSKSFVRKDELSREALK